MSFQKNCMNCKHYGYRFICLALPKVVNIKARKDYACSLFKPEVEEKCQ